jgi:DNA-binding NarL/FixJ family response regulator
VLIFFKTEPFENRVSAIRHVAAGGIVHSMRPPASKRLRLTVREIEVVSLVADGRSNDDIAARLAISVETVESHLTRIVECTNVGSRTELATRVIREGWLESAGQ